ncbi:hypothetical protein KIL84_019718 [Mauremys mutica]|uniref:Uncharacterized protein n=1 Tax=Mauremys mutica TaxID=74926 RepID=A0A9D3XSS4_9SAUR|nr:hypothetical protein KIL84_019718 [Mauremys mutica]
MKKNCPLRGGRTQVEGPVDPKGSRSNGVEAAEMAVDLPESHPWGMADKETGTEWSQQEAGTAAGCLLQLAPQQTLKEEGPGESVLRVQLEAAEQTHHEAKARAPDLTKEYAAVLDEETHLWKHLEESERK